MIQRALRGAGVLLLLAPLSLFAYGPKTVQRMTDASLRLAPAALRSALVSYKTDLDAGVSESVEGYGSAPRGEVLDALQKEADTIPGLFTARAPFPAVARHFGRAAGLIFLLNDPMMIGGDPRALDVRLDYYGYIERKLPILVVTFDGYDTPPLHGDVEAYMKHRLMTEKRYQAAVLFCYFPHGRRVSSETFDDRSNAFGVAQLVLSHAVSDTAKTWLYLWKSMDGDLSATPFYRPKGSDCLKGP